MTDKQYIAKNVKQLQKKFGIDSNDAINHILYVALPKSKNMREYIEQKSILMALYKGSRLFR